MAERAGSPRGRFEIDNYGHLTIDGALVLELLDEGADARWEYAHVYTEIDGTPRYRKVDEQTFRARQPDGHRSDGSPYWNYEQVKRRKAGPWVGA